MPNVSRSYLQAWAPAHPRASASGCIYVHVAVAEAALGHYLPDGAEIHHVDEHKHNNANGNLVICQSHAYHKLLHVRARVVKGGGDPNTQRICSTCKELKTFNAFNLWSASKSDGLQQRCRECQKRLYKGYVRPSKRAA